jgi:hypothetical protein
MEKKQGFKKKVRLIAGNMIGITFTKQEEELYGIKVGDHLDLSDMIIISDKLNKLKEEK